jgi:ribosome-binding factor A
LKRGIAKRVEIRTTPELRFYYDKSLEHGFHIDELIAKANKDLSND